MYIPQFIITSEINNALIEIEKLKQKIDSAKILPQQVVRLRYRATVDDVHSSTSIEGNQLNKKEVEQVMSGKLDSQEYAVIEVANYKKAFDWVSKNKDSKSPMDSKISIDQVLYLHNLVAQNLLPELKVGKFRKGPIYIVDIENGKEIIRYEGPAADEINLYLKDLFKWLSKKDKLNPIIKAAILHYEFVSIHPFSDGNGRVTRLLVKLFLNSVGYDFRGGLSLDNFYLENRLRYYEELNQSLDYQGQRKADLTDWINFFVTGFLVSVEKLAHQITILSVIDSDVKLDFSEDDVAILDYMRNFGSISSRDIVDMLGISERTAQRRLKRLVENNIITQKGAARNIKYELVVKK
ncbi:MAG: Fic family protein [Candidatus Pacebacteria bacterium]|nr:Fic family protein [Candidatus Paceibacterota bacterium]